MRILLADSNPDRTAQVGALQQGMMRPEPGENLLDAVTRLRPDIKPIIQTAIAIFSRFRQLQTELRRMEANLEERAAIDRAKALLIRAARRRGRRGRPLPLVAAYGGADARWLVGQIGRWRPLSPGSDAPAAGMYQPPLVAESVGDS